MAKPYGRWIEGFRNFSFPQPEGWIESMTPPFSEVDKEKVLKAPSSDRNIPGITRSHVPVRTYRCEHCEADWHESDDCPKKPL